MKKQRTGFIFLLLITVVITAVAQNTRSVQGTIIDENGAPVIGASIMLADNSKIGTVSDMNGKFVLSNIPVASKNIRISYIGYITKIIDISNKPTLSIQLELSGLELTEMVVVGYGVVPKAHQTGANNTINIEDIKDLAGPSLAMSLRGLIPGVNVSGGDSRPGSMARINIRQSDLFGTATSGFVPYTGPLYVIDGFITEDETDFNNLDPDMIESISILKDATAAVYGSRSANGVILVTTKKGTMGAPKISYSGQYGFTDAVSRVKLADTYNNALLSNAVSTANPRNVYDPLSLFQADELEHMKTLNYDLVDKYWRMAATYRHSVNVTGATEKVNYFAGISYYTQDGNIGKLSYDRWNYRAGLDAQIAKGFKASLQLSGDYGSKSTQYSKVTGETGENDYNNLFNHARYIPEYLSNGLPLATSTSGEGLYHFDLIQNMNNFSHSYPQNMTINTALEYDFGSLNLNYLKGLRMKVTYGKGINTSEGNQYASDYDIYSLITRGGSGRHLYTTDDVNLDENNIRTIKVSNGNFLRRTMDRGNRYQLNYQANYNRTFGSHEISAVFSIEKSESEAETLEGQVLNPYPFTNYQSNGAEGKVVITKQNPIGTDDEFMDGTTTVFSRTESGNLSYVGRLNYAYKHKYLAEFLMRTEASTKFAPENYWGTFYSLSGGWTISEENWFGGKLQEVLNYLKIRASFGLAGRDNIAAWQWLMTYGFEVDKGPIFGNNPSTQSGNHISIPDAVPNRDAHWDNSYKSNIGIDASVLKNRLSVGFDYYYEWNRDVFYTRQGSADYPTTVGAQASAENYGAVDNYGMELSLTWKGKIGKDFKYNVGVHTSYSDYKVLEKPWPSQFGFTDERPNEWTNKIGSYGYECIGMFRNYQEIEEYFAKYEIRNYCGLTKENVHPGMLIYSNIRGSQKADGTYYGPNDPEDARAGYVDGNDMVKINNRSNTWGFTTNSGVDWKGLALKFQLSASWGGYRMLSAGLSNPYAPFLIGNMFVYQDAYDAEGNIVVHQNLDAKYPNMSFGLNRNTSTFWRMNGLSLTLRNITLAYALPKQIVSKVGIESCRINVTGQNMLTLYNPFPGKYYDPLSGSYGNYPNLRRYNVSLNVSF